MDDYFVYGKVCNVRVYDFVCRRREFTHTYIHRHIAAWEHGIRHHNVTHMRERTHTHRLFVGIQSYDVRAVREIVAEHTQLVTLCAGSRLPHL